jgi:hypothetical protein
MHQLVTKKTLPLAIAGATLLALATVGTAPAAAALFRLTANLNDGNQFSITYDGDTLGSVNDYGVSYEGNIVDFSFVSPTFSFSLADFGTPTSSYSLILDAPIYGQPFIQNFIGGLRSTYFISGLPIFGDAFAPLTPTSLYTESRGSFLPAPGGSLSCCTPNFLLVFAEGLTSDNVSEFVEGGQAILLNSGGTYEIARIPIASTPEPVVPWWVAGALVGGWWLRGLRVGRKQ